MTDRDDDDDPPDGQGDFTERWALVALSVLMSMFGTIVAMLMLGSLAAGVEWLAPLLAMVVIMASVMGIGVAMAAIILGKQGRWAAFVFSILPCLTAVAAWAWEMRHTR